jgi:(p)ppGpp synthase/HD superfamily hydrolase
VRNASGGRPYIDHPIEVAERLSVRGYPDEVLAAALLHDVVEDSELEVEDVRRLGGDRVARIVATLTENESVEPYAERKREHRGRVREDGPESLAVYAADKLTNLSMLRDAYADQGEGIAGELKVPLEEKVTMWREDLEMLEGRCAGDPALEGLVDDFAEQLRRLARDRAAAAPPAP